jgi:hypothetical protein
MARIRTIKPGHVNDKELSKIPLQAHLFWVLSWCFSDDEGVMENDPLLLKSQLFPRRTDIRVEQIKEWIDHLIKARFIIPFTHDGEGYLLHRTFKIHQKIDRPQPSKIPEDTIRRMIDECSTNVRPCIVKDSIVEDSSVLVSADAPKKFIKPTVDELVDYFIKQNLDDFSAQGQAQRFFDHYTANGWKVGGRAAMKDWKASVRNWITNSKEFKNGTQQKFGTSAGGQKIGTREAALNAARNL